MIDKSKYTKIKAKTSLKVSHNKFGDVVEDTAVSTEVYKRRLVNKSGMVSCRLTTLSAAIHTAINSKKDYAIIDYMLTHYSQSGYVKNYTSAPASIEYIAKKLEIGTKKVSIVLKKLREADIVKKSGRVIYLNPYYVLPYGNSEEANYILQLKWTHDYKYTEEELREIYSTDLQVNREVEI